jgi:uncharacterized protein YdeI (YjbR/CyaY-like superfamily)
MARKLPEDRPLTFASREEWRRWLEENHASQNEAWLVHPKKGAPPGALSLEEGVEEALCFGWVDSVLQPIDEMKYTLRYSPRRRGSVWSAGNIERAERLIAEGRMTESGLAAIRHAQESGEWERTLRREVHLELPPELAAALEADPQAAQRFERLPPSHKKQYIYWVASAKRAETRQKRAEQTLTMLRDQLKH